MMVKEIPLTQGKIALVDDDDYELLSKFKWHAYKDRKVFYARRTFISEDKSKRKLVYMHQILISIPKGFQCDHINRNSLDNRRINLRVATSRQNNINHGRTKTSNHPGVCFEKFTGRWKAQIGFGKKNYNLGRYDTEEEAHQAYLNALPVSGYP